MTKMKLDAMLFGEMPKGEPLDLEFLKGVKDKRLLDVLKSEQFLNIFKEDKFLNQFEGLNELKGDVPSVP